jgi:hypothetical protein
LSTIQASDRFTALPDEETLAVVSSRLRRQFIGSRRTVDHEQ